MIRDTYRALLISDFNLDNFRAALNADESPPRVEAHLAPYGQVGHTLHDAAADCWSRELDFAIVWTQPHSVVDLFAALVRGDTVAVPELLAQVDGFADALAQLQDRVSFALVCSWLLPDGHAPTGVLDLKQATGIRNVLMQMNLRLADQLRTVPNLFLLDSERWLRLVGKTAFNPKLWYMAKTPFASDVWAAAIDDIKAAIHAVTGQTRKLIIVDLDNTLWGGIVGDLGWEGLTLGGHDPIGEAYADFQSGLKTIRKQGTLLAIASKNEEAVALEAIDNHPEMVLRRDDFCTWRINWNDKATNIADLVAELNLGLQSAVFLDDNPVERARVREALPEILVPDLPEDKMRYRSFLMRLRCFDKPGVSQEDRDRTTMYRQEQARAVAREKVGSFDQWLQTLETKVTVSALDSGNVTRTVQLLNKTNQMNLSTRRLTAAELHRWLATPGRDLRTFRVRDRFGDSGLTGILSWERQDDTLAIVDFVLSCRVMGRRIEETLLAVAIAHARQQALTSVHARYLPTKKNAPCLRFLHTSGWKSECDGTRFRWDCALDYPVPAGIELESE